jgi:hypothetical protein
MSHSTVDDLDAGVLALRLAHGARATSSAARMSSQRYTPRYPAIRRKTPRKSACTGPPGNDLPQSGVPSAGTQRGLPGAKIGANEQSAIPTPALWEPEQAIQTKLLYSGRHRPPGKRAIQPAGD